MTNEKNLHQRPHEVKIIACQDSFDSFFKVNRTERMLWDCVSFSDTISNCSTIVGVLNDFEVVLIWYGSFDLELDD